MKARNDADRVDTRLRGWRLGLAWLAWTVVFLLTLALLAYLAPANYRLTRVEWAVEQASPAAEALTSYRTFVRIIVVLETARPHGTARERVPADHEPVHAQRQH
jgi:hypothetical protein